MKLNYVNVYIVYEYLFRTGKISNSIAKRVKNRKAAPSRLCFIERCHLANSKNRSFLTSFSRGFNKSDSKRHLFILKTPNTKISYNFLPTSPRACKIDNLHFTEASKSNLSPPNLSSVRRETFIRFNLFHRKKTRYPSRWTTTPTFPTTRHIILTEHIAGIERTARGLSFELRIIS